MLDRLYENLLKLIGKKKEQDSNSTFCNLNQLYEKVKQKKAIAFIIVHIIIKKIL